MTVNMNVPEMPDHDHKPLALVPRVAPADTAVLDLHDRRTMVERTIKKLLGQRASGQDLSELDARIEYLYYDLGATREDPQHVETYDGTLGVSRSFVDRYERPVGQLCWQDDLPNRFQKPGDDIGNVNGLRWGTGALISDDLFLTAGHCFKRQYPAWQVPRRNGKTISPEEMATEMYVTFNCQIDGSTGRLRLGISYPVLNLLEHSAGDLDYAILRLGRDGSGRLPGQVFGKLKVAKEDLTARNAVICILQHPNRQGKKEGKKVEAGHLMDYGNGRLAYNDVGTSGGASGSPILNAETGEIVGVHVKGGSSPIGGFNSGTAIGAIRAASKLLHLTDDAPTSATQIASVAMPAPQQIPKQPDLGHGAGSEHGEDVAAETRPSMAKPVPGPATPSSTPKRSPRPPKIPAVDVMANVAEKKDERAPLQPAIAQ